MKNNIKMQGVTPDYENLWVFQKKLENLREKELENRKNRFSDTDRQKPISFSCSSYTSNNIA